jgi:hypothetical protein
MWYALAIYYTLKEIAMARTAFSPEGRYGDKTIFVSDTQEDFGIRFKPNPRVRWILHYIELGVNSQDLGIEYTIKVNGSAIWFGESYVGGAPVTRSFGGAMFPPSTTIEIEIAAIDLPGPAPVPPLHVKNVLMSADVLTSDPLNVGDLVELYDVTDPQGIGSAAVALVSDSY